MTAKALTLPAGHELDRAADAIILGSTGQIPSRAWSTDSNAIDAVYDPLAQTNDWCLGFDPTAPNAARRGWIVLNANNEVLAQATVAALARLRAVLAWHMAQPTKTKRGRPRRDDQNTTAGGAADDVAAEVSGQIRREQASTRR